MVNDWTLIRRYAESGDESAFEELVARYSGLVYSSAVRRVGAAHADDVAQAVFVVLARKAPTLKPGRAKSLAGWLFRVTRYAASELARTESRRAQRERNSEADTMTFNEPATANAAWDHVAPLLDQALDSLKSGERDAVVLRYLQGARPAAIGEALGISENAASKRVSRGLAALRNYFQRRNLTVSLPVLTLLLSTRSVETAAAGWAATCTAAALAAAQTPALPGTAAALAAGTLKSLAAARAQAVALAVVLPVAVAATAAAVALGPARREPAPDRPHPEAAGSRAQDALFPLVYKARNTLPDNTVEYQLNDLASGKTYFVTLGETVNGYTVTGHDRRFEEQFAPQVNRTRKIDRSTLTLERDGRTVTLAIGSPARMPQHARTGARRTP